MNTDQVARRLVELCRQGQYEAAQKELYADGATSTEPAGASMPPAHGLAAIVKKGHDFMAMIETMHGGSVSEPLVAGNFFAAQMMLDVTMKGMGRMEMNELCLYEVRDGKIVSEQFFYTPG